MASKITIIDYGLGNLLSISNMLNYLNIEYKITNNPEEIENAQKLIIPGVGSFDTAIYLLKKNKIFNSIMKAFESNVIILGICLGMQIFYEKSDEGNCNGLGILKGKIVKFKKYENIIIPHIGWNSINSNNIAEFNLKNKKFYFLHSYHPEVTIKQHFDSVKYSYNFPAVIKYNNVFGVQFHPEKSGENGMQFFKEFNLL